MLLRNSILLRADHPGSGSAPLPCTALALSWKLLLVQATLTTTQVTGDLWHHRGHDRGRC